MLARPAEQLAELEIGHARAFRFDAAAAVEDLEHEPAHVLLEREVVIRRRPRLDDAPALLPEGLVPHVIGGTLLHIVQDEVGLVNLAEARVVARVRIIRMEPARQQAEDALNRVEVGVLADLQNFVVVLLAALFHCRNPSLREPPYRLRPGTPLSGGITSPALSF